MDASRRGHDCSVSDLKFRTQSSYAHPIKDDSDGCIAECTQDFMTELSSLIERNISSIFNQRSARKRKAALKTLWSPNGVLWTARGSYMGHRNIERAIASLLQSYPEFDFTIVGKVDEIPDAARTRWSFGVIDAPPAITGMDVVLASHGQIVAMYRFLDGADL